MTTRKEPGDRGSERRPSDPGPSKEQRTWLTRHRGLATTGDAVVPLSTFVAATDAVPSKSKEERERRVATFLAPKPGREPVEGPFRRVLLFGGVYSNHFALRALLDEARRLNVDAVYCLGDLGGFGPTPEKVWPLLLGEKVRCLMGNYEESLASGREDCNCGYADPRDNHFAEISYRYTAERCSAAFRSWMGQLPRHRRLRIGQNEILLVHGSPRRINEFLFASTTPNPYLEVLLRQYRSDGLFFTHTGLPWQRQVSSGGWAVNVGVIGRPANDGNPLVWYSLVELHDGALAVELRRLDYDYEALASEMEEEALPSEFVDTIRTGWWTTCLEVLPARERQASRY